MNSTRQKILTFGYGILIFLSPIGCKHQIKHEDNSLVKLGGNVTEVLNNGQKHYSSFGFFHLSENGFLPCTGNNLGRGFILTTVTCLQGLYHLDDINGRFYPANDEVLLTPTLSHEMSILESKYRHYNELKIGDATIINIYLLAGTSLEPGINNSLVYNIAIVQLDEPLDEFIEVAQIYPDRNFSGPMAKVVGMGYEGQLNNERRNFILNKTDSAFRLQSGTVEIETIRKTDPELENLRPYFPPDSFEVFSNNLDLYYISRGPSFGKSTNAELWKGDTGGGMRDIESDKIVALFADAGTGWKDGAENVENAYVFYYKVAQYAEQINNLVRDSTIPTGWNRYLLRGVNGYVPSRDLR